jgi:hypothetical protein
MNLFLLSFIISFPLYLLNLELNPSLGHIYLRPNPEGKIVFVGKNIIRYLIQPFINPEFWKPRMWDINYITFYLFTLVILFFLNLF